MTLHLKRETLAELTADELATIGGGQTDALTPRPIDTLQVRECFIIVTADQACLGNLPTIRECLA